MRFRVVVALAGASWVLLAAEGAAAGPVDEVRFGVMAHNICTTVCDNAGKEDGVNLLGEVVFTPPRALAWAGSPRPYLVASVNTAEETSYGGVGLTWTLKIADRWRIEPGLGYVLHSNTDNLDNPYPPDDPHRGPYQEENLLLGSEDLFRLSVAVTRELTPRWGVQVALEHLSHGQILGHGRNEGMDEAGVRLTYKLGR